MDNTPTDTDTDNMLYFPKYNYLLVQLVREEELSYFQLEFCPTDSTTSNNQPRTVIHEFLGWDNGLRAGLIKGSSKDWLT
jgi:hypothetical protein